MTKDAYAKRTIVCEHVRQRHAEPPAPIVIRSVEQLSESLENIDG